MGAHLAIDDPLPAGLEAVNTKLRHQRRSPPSRNTMALVGTAADLEPDGEAWSQPAAREMRDDRVLVFVDGL